MKDLTPLSHQPISKLSEENIWLANFVSPCTRQTYRHAVAEFAAFHNIGSEVALHEIRQAHVIIWREALCRTGASPKTINNRISAVSSLFKHLCETQITRINPTTGVKRPSVQSNTVKTPAITPQQVRSALDAPDLSTLKGLRNSAILHILFYTGCRISEVCHLRVKDFCEDAGYHVLDLTVKGGKRNRIAIHPELQIALKRYLAATGHSSEQDSPLLLALQKTHLRKPLTRIQINNIFHTYTKAINLPPNVTPHSARATFITQALERKCPIENVQHSVGHSKIATTQMYDKRTVKFRDSASLIIGY